MAEVISSLFKLEHPDSLNAEKHVIDDDLMVFYSYRRGSIATPSRQR
jgi:hypothetical protein